MAIHKTRALILRRNDYRNTSLLVTVLTEEFGRFKGIVKGIKGTYKKFGTSFEPLTLNEIIFYSRPTTDLFLISHAELLDDFGGVGRTPEQTATGSYFAETIEHLTAPLDPQFELFDLLRTSLRALPRATNEQLITQFFEIKLLKYLGLLPRINHCSSCSVSLSRGGYIRPNGKDILCHNCFTEDEDVYPVSNGSLATLSCLRDNPWDKVDRLRATLSMQDELTTLLRSCIVSYLDRPLRSINVLDKLITLR